MHACMYTTHELNPEGMVRGDYTDRIIRTLEMYKFAFTPLISLGGSQT